MARGQNAPSGSELTTEIAKIVEAVSFHPKSAQMLRSLFSHIVLWQPVLRQISVRS